MTVLCIKKCSTCGKEIKIKHKHRLKNKNWFCCINCSAKFTKKKPNLKCFICGKDIYVKPSKIKKIKDGKACCSKECSNLKRTTWVGNKNPNYRYKADYSCIYNLDSFGAYILGMIWSDGHIGKTHNSIFISQKDCSILKQISKKIYGDDLVKKEDKRLNCIHTLKLHSKDLIDHLLSLGGIKRGKKSKMVEIPNIDESLKWPFICGYFDGDGGFKYNFQYPEINIASNSKKILAQIAKYWEVNYPGGTSITASGYKALDICGKMYESSPIKLNRKYDYYLQMINWEPKPYGKWREDGLFKYKKFSKDSIPPQKTRVTDSGYDICAIEYKKMDWGDEVYMLDTRLAVEPIRGWYFDLIGRSSLPKNNLHFVGGVGVIDRSYVGSVKMLVQKINKNLPLPPLPFKCGQLVPRRVIHIEFKEVDSFSESSRSDGGFGSTD